MTYTVADVARTGTLCMASNRKIFMSTTLGSFVGIQPSPVMFSSPPWLLSNEFFVSTLSLFYSLFPIALSSNECKWLSPSAKHTISAVLLLQWLNQWNRSTLYQGEKNQRIPLIPIIRPPNPKPRNHEQKNHEITIDNSTWNWSTRTSICLFSILYNISCVSTTENYSLFQGKLDQKIGDMNKREVSDFLEFFSFHSSQISRRITHKTLY